MRNKIAVWILTKVLRFFGRAVIYKVALHDVNVCIESNNHFILDTHAFLDVEVEGEWDLVLRKATPHGCLLEDNTFVS